MIRFKLFDENNDYKEYVLELNFQDTQEFLDFIHEDIDFKKFMKMMETGHEPWCGEHDFSARDLQWPDTDDDGIEYVGYTSYEIVDFDAAIEKWKEFFRSKGKLIESDEKPSEELDVEESEDEESEIEDDEDDEEFGRDFGQFGYRPFKSRIDDFNKFRRKL